MAHFSRDENFPCNIPLESPAADSRCHPELSNVYHSSSIPISTFTQSQIPKIVVHDMSTTATAKAEDELLKLLMTDLEERKKMNKLLEQRLISDERQFIEIEQKLRRKFIEYQNKTLSEIDDKYSNYDVKYVDHILTNIVGLESQIKFLEKEQLQRNMKQELYHKICENKHLENQMNVLSQRCAEITPTNNNNNDDSTKNKKQSTHSNNNKNDNISEASKLNKMHKKTLQNLRNELDKIRQDRKSKDLPK